MVNIIDHFDANEYVCVECTGETFFNFILLQKKINHPNIQHHKMRILHNAF